MFLLLFCACLTVVALEKLYSWATDPLFVYQLSHMLEKVENPCAGGTTDTVKA